ncbi:uncharacterized protein E5676_scaffold96G001330 [Cucumis melo var. makuwa]|uniref:Ubiquitin-like protease family profile domain-containing protein n=1 Tax=Cucumis melo var. makuwa TaxID=1194695 RepID=A0A5D3CYI8_CUCMM|nr:uncharacterized protein E5676_scaffold96G001330 [Cucumis melo var. makuwa]
MTLGKQARLEAGCSSIPSTEGVINKGKGTRRPTGMSEITQVSCDGHKRVVEYNELGQPISESATKLKIFIGTTVRVHVRSVTNRGRILTEQFETVSDKGHEQRKNNKYNHRMSQKGYGNLAEEMKASTSSGGLIDRALVWKKALTTKDGKIPDKDSKEENLLVSKRVTHSMDIITCDILSQAIGGSDPSGRIRGGSEVATNGQTDESKIKSQMASKSIDKLDDANDHDAEEENRQVLEEEVEIEDLTIEKQDKVGDKNKDVCASIGTLTKVKDNVIGVGTIFDYDMDDDNVKVSVDMVFDGNCFVPIPTREGRIMLSQEVGSQLLWPRHLVIPLDEKALQEFCQMKPISIQCIDAFMFHLYKVMEEKGTLGSYKFANADSVSVDIIAIDFTRGTTYWMDPLRNRINNDASDVVQMAFDISSRKKPVLKIIKCSKKGGIVECGYYVMRFMCDIILSSNRTIIEMEGSTSTYSQDDLDVVRTEWAEFVNQYIFCSQSQSYGSH